MITEWARKSEPRNSERYYIAKTDTNGLIWLAPKLQISVFQKNSFYDMGGKMLFHETQKTTKLASERSQRPLVLIPVGNGVGGNGSEGWPAMVWIRAGFPVRD